MKTETFDINLEQYDKDLLIALIRYAHERDLTFNEAIVQILKFYLAQESLQETS
jgi:hypothetical protein